MFVGRYRSKSIYSAFQIVCFPTLMDEHIHVYVGDLKAVDLLSNFCRRQNKNFHLYSFNWKEAYAVKIPSFHRKILRCYKLHHFSKRAQMQCDSIEFMMNELIISFSVSIFLF